MPITSTKTATGNSISSLTADVTAVGPGAAAATVVTVGGSTAANIASAEALANAATSAATANAIVRRNASGNASLGLIGVTDGSTAAAGIVGEKLSQTRLRSATLALTTATPVNLTATSLTLTTGEWEIHSAVSFLPAAATTISALDTCVSTTSATFSASDTVSVQDANGQIRGRHAVGTTAPGAVDIQVVTIPSLVRLSGSVTFYLVVQAGFAVSTMTAHGSIIARRVR